MSDPMAILKVLKEVGNELSRAEDIFRSFHSSHEGYAVLKEEVDELWGAIKNKEPKATTARAKILRKEAIQVAAMAVRFVLDVTGDG